MDHHFERYDRIRQMREAGESIDEVVSDLGISWQMGEVIRRMIRKFETEAVLSARSNRFMEEIRKADDLDKKWKVSYLVQAVRPQTMTQNAIIRHFQWDSAVEISLRQLMDLAISEQDHPKPGYQITPLLNVRRVGIDGFRSLVTSLTKSDLGEKGNEEWNRRLKRLRRCTRILGGERGWSKPCEFAARL